MTALVHVLQKSATAAAVLMELMAGATVILVVAGMAVLFMRRQSAALRHRVWALAIAGLLVLPGLALLLPDWGPAWPARNSNSPQTAFNASAQQPSVDAAGTDLHSLPLDSVALRKRRGLDFPEWHQAGSRSRTAPGTAEAARGRNGEREASGSSLARVRQSPSLPAAETSTPSRSAADSQGGAPAKARAMNVNVWGTAAAVWLAGVIVGLMVFARRYLWTIRMAERCPAVTNPDDVALKERIRESFGVRRAVPLRCSSEVVVPLTVGCLRSVILLPAGYGQWSKEQLRVVLAHEMAHIRRRDVLWQLMARLACCLYWCHPLLWLASWRLRVEREYACDDAVLALGELPERYATHLVDVAAALGGGRTAPQAGVAMACRCNLLERVQSILHPRLKRAPVSRRAGRLLCVITLAVVAATGLMSPATSQTEHADPETEQAPAAAPTTEETKEAADKQSDDSAEKNPPPMIDSKGEVPTPGEMEIRVVDSQGNPLPGAKIQIGVWTREPFDPSRTYTCDEEGQTEIELPKSLRILRIWARQKDYVPLFAQWWPQRQRDGQPIPATYTFRLPEGTTIGGQVKDEEGQPIEGVTVEVMRESGPAEGNSERPLLGTWLAYGDGALTTDRAGRWKLTNVPAGDDVEVRIKLSHPEYVSDQSWGGLQKEQLVTMKALRNQSAVIAMRRGIAVTGTVTDPQGKPVSGALVIWGDDPYFQTGSQEVRTDETGVYRFPPLPPGETTVTVVAEDWRPELKQIDIRPDMPAVDFSLEKGSKLRIRFVDPSGKPVPNVFVSVREWRGVKSLYNHKHPNVLDSRIPIRADENGVFEWTWAPDDAVTYSFGTEKTAEMEMSLTADGTEQTVTLQPKLSVSGTVSDASTGAPLDRFQVVPVIHFSADLVFVNRSERVDAAEGRFEITFERTDVQHGVRIEAAGYRTRQVGPWKIGDPPQELTVQMQPAAPIQGRVVDPGGRPVVGAEVYLSTRTQHLDIRNVERGDEDAFLRMTDARGRFSFPAQYEPYALVAIHDSGYADVLREPQEQPGALRLQRWARVEGRVFQAGRPVAGHRVRLKTLRPEFPPFPRVDETFSVETDKAGRFMFDRVPPVQCVVSPALSVWEDSPITSSQSVPLDLQPGQNRTVDLNGDGADVTGRVVLSGAKDREIDLNYSLNYLLALRDGIEPPPAVAAKGFDWKNGWSDAWTRTQEGTVYKETLHHYFVKLNRDGTFHISGVPSGKYELALMLYAPPEEGCLVQPVASRQVRFDVTEAHAQSGLDLGDVHVEAHFGPQPGEPAPDFTFETLEGGKRSLSSLRGRYVLIDVWATWCAPCLARLPVMQAIHRQAARSDKLVVLGLNLDRDRDKAREFVKERNLSWMQGFLGDWSESSFPARYAVNSIPAYLLIGPDGKLIHKGYKAEELRPHLRDLLGRPSP